jgi:hypothetical protein
MTHRTKDFEPRTTQPGLCASAQLHPSGREDSCGDTADPFRMRSGIPWLDLPRMCVPRDLRAVRYGRRGLLSQSTPFVENPL